MSFSSEASAADPLISLPLAEPSLTQQASLEAMALIKRQHRAHSERLQELLNLKERTVRELSQRLSAAESELVELRRSAQGEESRVYEKVRDLALELENAQRVFKDREARFKEEEKVLRGIAESVRRQLAEETSRWRELEHHWGEREQQYLLDIQEMQAMTKRGQQEALKSEGQARRAMEDLKSAKTAIEKTLSELLLERHQREQSDQERDKALARVKEMEERFQELQNVWQEERKQWQELWNRERSTWETQRQEFQSWEEKVRRERQDWHRGLQEIETRETRHAEQMAEMLRKTSDAGEKVATFLKGFSAVGVAPAVQGPKRAWRGRGWIALAASLALGASFVFRWASHRLSFELVSSQTLASANPTALSYDGNVLWTSTWQGDFLALDPRDPSAVIARRAKPAGLGSYHPLALAYSGDSFYSIDAAQGRIIRHALGSFEVRSVWRSPGPAPVALAYDGKNLWSYDAVTRNLYRHLGEGFSARTEPYALGMDALPGAIYWHAGRLWMYDLKGERMLVFSLKDGVLSLSKSQRVEAPIKSFALVTLAAKGGLERLELWALIPPSEGSPEATLKKFRVR